MPGPPSARACDHGSPGALPVRAGGASVPRQSLRGNVERGGLAGLVGPGCAGLVGCAGGPGGSPTSLAAPGPVAGRSASAVPPHPVGGVAGIDDGNVYAGSIPPGGGHRETDDADWPGPACGSIAGGGGG
ncbi:MAG TPA: hypothetical protein VFM54_08035 [Micromonosporaceae bacterium]|nr:hypothetical protein [Micromonosporaceae bacterium]